MKVTFLSPKKREILVILLAFIFVLSIYLIGIRQSSKSTAHERQNQTLEISRQIYENGLLSFWQPKANFANIYAPQYPPSQSYTVIRFEFPFHGVLGYLFSKIFGFHGWIYTTISLLFSLITIVFSLLFFRLFNGFYASSFGLLLLVLSPLFLHFGQVAMPDIVALTGLVTSLYFAGYTANRASTIANDRWTWIGFLTSAILFAVICVLGKPNLIPYGLPVALLAIKSFRQRKTKFIAFCLYWLIAVMALALWNLLIYLDPPGSWNILKASAAQAPLLNLLLSPSFYIKTISWATLFGLGIPGIVFLFPAIPVVFRERRYRLWVPSALFSIGFVYLSQRTYMIREPQYTLIVLFWLIFIAVIGINELTIKGSKILSSKIFLVVFMIHLLMVTWGTLYLKADKLPNSGSLVSIGNLIPLQAKIVQISPSYGATPTYFLNRQTALFMSNDKEPILELKDYQALGYNYLMFFDYSLSANSFSDIVQQKRITVVAKSLAPQIYNYAQKHFDKVFELDGVTLFKMVDNNESL